MNKSTQRKLQTCWVVPLETSDPSQHEADYRGANAAAVGTSTKTTSKSSNSIGKRSFLGVELVKTGTWSAQTGEVTITRADLAAAVAAQRHFPTPVLRLGHQDPRFDGSPALGKVKNLRLSDAGNTLLGDLIDVPQWLAHDLHNTYPQRSVEGLFNTTANGHHFRFVVTGLALLGSEPPAVSTLKDLQELIQEG